MKRITLQVFLALTVFLGFTFQAVAVHADDDTTSLKDFFKQGTVKGQLKTIITGIQNSWDMKLNYLNRQKIKIA